MSESGSASQSSFSSRGDSSVADTTDGRMIDNIQSRNDPSDPSNVLYQGKTLEDAIFASLYTLSKERKATDLRWTAARVILEFLQMFRVVFNTVFAWKIDTNLWIWKVFYWVLFRLVVMPQGYDTYIAVFYALSVVVLVSIALTVWVAFLLKKEENVGVWVRRLVSMLQFISFFMFSVFWVAVMDYFCFMFNCEWSQLLSPGGPVHHVFSEHSCIAMPHLAHMVFALVMLLLFAFTTICMAIGDCDLNPLSLSHLASPVAVTSIRTMALKMAMVIISTTGTEIGQAQSVLMLICAAIITYYLLTTTPYYFDVMNYLWVGLWSGIVFTTCMLVALDYTLNAHAENALQYRQGLTQAVLYGIFPAVLLGMIASYCYIRFYLRRPLAKLAQAYDNRHTGIKLREVHRFKGVFEVEFLMRVGRKWDEEGIPDTEAVGLAEFILKCGLARMPSQPTLLTLYANLILASRKDNQAARSQIQVAVKNKPDLLERYFIYVHQEVIKSLRTDSQGLDLIGFIEFQRAYRSCVFAHQLALQAQRQFWVAMLRDHVSFKVLQDSVELLISREKQATAMYRSVMERYPANGKLLKAYGRFLEFVRNDPWGASKFYTEAVKQGVNDSLLSMAGNSAEAAVVTSFSGSTANARLGAIDERIDAVIIINATGSILMVNGACNRMYGYAKGELDGKNVSVLMPQPFSSRHNDFMSRYHNTGESRILGQMREVVGLHKDRTVFPAALFVQKLSGVGQDAIYMGVLRSQAAAQDPKSVRVWTMPSGIVICTSDNFTDCLGIPYKQIIGKHISTLTDQTAELERAMTEFLQLASNDLLVEETKICIKLLHKYLPPIQAEVSLELGGSRHQPLIIFKVQCLDDASALMVTDTRGRIQFATSQLAAMVGHSAKALKEGMNINMLLPPPYTYLHAGLMKDLSLKPHYRSCRAGAVVHLLHANNSKVPVTLQISQHDDGEHTQHVVKVAPATETQLLNQQRVELQLNHKGMVLAVNDNASRDVFGFNPAEMVGRPLAAFVNVFSMWRQKFGEDDSLLVTLGMRAQQNLDVIYRVGIHKPFTDEEMQAGADTSMSGAASTDPTKTSLLGALKSRRKDVPAIMSLVMAQAADESDIGGLATSTEDTAVLTISLWRSEGLTAIVETDSKLTIVRAEPTVGLIFGLPIAALLRKSFRSLVGLPKHTDGDGMLSSATGGRRGMLKHGAAWKTGPVQSLDVKHIDGGQMKLKVQAISKDGKSARGLQLLVRLVDTSTGTLQPLLSLRTSGNGQNPLGMLVQHDSDPEDEGADEMIANPELLGRVDSRRRVLNWVSFNCKDTPDDQAAERATKEQKQPLARLEAELMQPDDDDNGGMDPVGNASSAGSEEDNRAAAGMEGLAADANMMRRSALDDGASDYAGSQVSGSQVGAKEAVDAADAASGAEEEVVADWRRAKRLKKLNRMMTCGAAQVAAERFRKHTYLMILVLLAAHTVCFAVLYTQIEERYQTAYEVGDMAQGVERSQMAVMRANLLQKCASPDFSHMPLCTPASVQGYLEKLYDNYEVLKRIHQGLYLGFSELKQFRDARLTEYWTTRKLPETVWYQNHGTDQEKLVYGNSTLWNMGNRYLRCQQDVLYNAKLLGHDLEHTSYFQYMYHNGPNSLYMGYVWSLDVFVDYACKQLGTLGNVLLVLLILEVVVVQFIGMLYEFVILRAANVEAMKRFSVFLALPSAVMRVMASKQLQVDDDDTEGVDEEELEALNAATAAAAAVSNDQVQSLAKAPEAKTKSVRMSEPGFPGNNAGKQQASSRRRSIEGRRPQESKKPKSVWQKANKLLFGWSRTVFKVNGKKLEPCSHILWRFMVPLLLWVVVVAIIFGTSLDRLDGLQGPVVSLYTAAHVRFRVARVRLVANMYGMATSTGDRDKYREQLLHELTTLRQEYDALMYGGEVATVVDNLTFDARSPAAAFSNKEFSNLFFKSTACLRAQQSSCFTEDSPWYAISRGGLDAMVMRFMDQLTVFANLPDTLAYANHTSYQYVTQVAAHDMYDGLQTAAQLFSAYTISKFEEVKQLHIILLVCTLVLCACFMWKIFRPYVLKLHAESKVLAGIMSQLPADIDIEDHIKQHVLGIRKEDQQGSINLGPAPASAAGAIVGAPYEGMNAANWRIAAPGLLPESPNRYMSSIPGGVLPMTNMGVPAYGR